MIWSKKKFSDFFRVFWPFLGPRVAILWAFWAKWPVVGGPRGPGGPKTIQDPKKHVFGSKKNLQKFFVGVQKKFFGRVPRPGRVPGPAAGRGAQSGPKRHIQGSGTCFNDQASSKTYILTTIYDIKSFCVAQDMPETRFFGPFLGHFMSGRVGFWRPFCDEAA